jgi:hypothetical protein
MHVDLRLIVPAGTSHRPSVSIIADSSDASLPLHWSFSVMPLGIWTVNIEEAARSAGESTVVSDEEVIAGHRSISTGPCSLLTLTAGTNARLCCR